MNPLELYILFNNLDPVITMNMLTEAGLISDNAVKPVDVAEPDATKAVNWLAENE